MNLDSYFNKELIKEAQAKKQTARTVRRSKKKKKVLGLPLGPMILGIPVGALVAPKGYRGWGALAGILGIPEAVITGGALRAWQWRKALKARQRLLRRLTLAGALGTFGLGGLGIRALMRRGKIRK